MNSTSQHLGAFTGVALKRAGSVAPFGVRNNFAFGLDVREITSHPERVKNTYMSELKTASEINVRASALPNGHLAVHAVTKDNRTLVVVWDAEGTGYPVTDDLEDSESDEVFAAVKGAGWL